MAKYDETAEGAGKYIIAFINATGEVSQIFEKKTREMFQEVLGEIDPEAYYNQEDIVEAYERIVDEVGANTMKRGGEKSAEILPVPAEASLEETLEMVNEEHKNQYRNSDMEYPAGKYLYKLDGRSARLGVDEVYNLPKSFVEGFYQGIVKKYGPEDAVPTFEEVEPEENEKFVWEATW